GLENRCGCKLTVGSNPTSSASVFMLVDESRTDINVLRRPATLRPAAGRDTSGNARRTTP
ncbi:MAG: hypothetical protein JWN86_314, partial [Planctomycetota bacterium]|nr:hypothetical protein [Planctomycetota bacterium]